MKRFLVIAALALAAPPAALARGEFDPTTEFEQHKWIPIHLGPLDLSITKAVAYLMIGTVVTIALGIFTMRSRLALLPDKRQTVGEAIRRRSASRSTRWRRPRSPSRDCRRRESASGSRMSRR